MRSSHFSKGIRASPPFDTYYNERAFHLIAGAAAIVNIIRSRILRSCRYGRRSRRASSSRRSKSSRRTHRSRRVSCRSSSSRRVGPLKKGITAVREGETQLEESYEVYRDPEGMGPLESREGSGGEGCSRHKKLGECSRVPGIAGE